MFGGWAWGVEFRFRRLSSAFEKVYPRSKVLTSWIQTFSSAILVTGFVHDLVKGLFPGSAEGLPVCPPSTASVDQLRDLVQSNGAWSHIRQNSTRLQEDSSEEATCSTRCGSLNAPW